MAGLSASAAVPVSEKTVRWQPGLAHERRRRNRSRHRRASFLDGDRIGDFDDRTRGLCRRLPVRRDFSQGRTRLQRTRSRRSTCRLVVSRTGASLPDQLRLLLCAGCAFAARPRASPRSAGISPGSSASRPGLSSSRGVASQRSDPDGWRRNRIVARATRREYCRRGPDRYKRRTLPLEPPALV